MGKPNGVNIGNGLEHDDAEGEDQDSRTPTEPPSSPRKAGPDHDQLQTNGQLGETKETSTESSEPVKEGHQQPEDDSPEREHAFTTQDSASTGPVVADSAEMDPDFKALLDERASLREEVAQVRRSLNEAQESHEEELATVREQLSESRTEKEQAEAQYRGLLGKVSTIRSQLGERLKADAVRSIYLLVSQTTDKLIGGFIASTKSNRRPRRTVCGSSTTE